MRASARAANLAWVVLLGAASYFAALWLLGFRIKDFSKRAAE
jgi:putative peptidoglycan lipid II flippase